MDEIPEATHPSKRTKLINKVITAALVVVGLALALFLYWSFQSSEVLVIKNSPFPSKIIQQGENRVVILKSESCKNADIEGTLRISFVSQTRELFQPTVTERSPKGCKDLSFPILVPKDIPADTYRIKFRAIYNVNPLKQNIMQDFESQPVTITSDSTVKAAE